MKQTVSWVPVSIETLVDAGRWDELTPDQQREYLAREAERERWARSWRGRWIRLLVWVDEHRPRVHAHLGPCWHGGDE